MPDESWERNHHVQVIRLQVCLVRGEVRCTTCRSDRTWPANLRPSSWEDGIAAAYRYEPKAIFSRHAFLTPSIDGWVLCVSTAFFKLGRSNNWCRFSVI